MFAFHNVGPVQTFILDNTHLLDVGNLIAIQESAAGGTLIRNNPMVCFNADGGWGSRSDSYIEFSFSQVRL